MNKSTADSLCIHNTLQDHESMNREAEVPKLPNMGGQESRASSEFNRDRSDREQIDAEDGYGEHMALFAHLSDPTPAASTSKAIARMVEPALLTQQELALQKIIHPLMDDSRTVDLYRELRTKLLYNSEGQNRTTLVTSVLPKGGATHVALNLAAAFAFDHSKTSLLIDCNLRDPQLHNRLYLDPQAGLTDFLDREIFGLDNIIYATGIERLRLIPAGASREMATEYFTSMRMKALLDVLKNRYSDRHVFIDAPSVTKSADARILAELCDQVLLVIPYGKSQSEAVSQAIESIGRHKIAGIVVNNESR